MLRITGISEEEVTAAIKGLKIGKAAGPTDVVSEMMKASVDSKRNSLQAVDLSRWLQTAVQIVSKLHAPSNGGQIYRFSSSRPCGPAGWLTLLLKKADDVETNPVLLIMCGQHEGIW